MHMSTQITSETIDQHHSATMEPELIRLYHLVSSDFVRPTFRLSADSGSIVPSKRLLVGCGRSSSRVQGFLSHGNHLIESDRVLLIPNPLLLDHDRVLPSGVVVHVLQVIPFKVFQDVERSQQYECVDDAEQGLGVLRLPIISRFDR